MRYCIIVNPNAGKKRGLQETEHLKEALESQGHKYDVLVSEKPGAAPGLASSINPEDYDGIISAGGDGTLFEVVNGLLAENGILDTPVGVLPVGTGNSFIKDLGLESREEAIRAILEGNTKNVDVGEFSYSGGSHFFINLLGAGFVSNVAYTANRFKKFGALSYIIGVLKELMVMKTTRITMEVDEKTVEEDVLFVEICNSRYTGGDMMMAPDAAIDDGAFDVVYANGMSRIRLLKIFPKIFTGTHVDDPLIKVLRGSKVNVISESPMALTPDGETFGTTPIEATLHPSRIRMFC